MSLSVSEYANRRGVSRQRALSMVQRGLIAAERVGHSWVIDERELSRRVAHGRPLGRRMANLLVNGMSGQPLTELQPGERFYIAGYLERLRQSEDQPGLLFSWMRARQSAMLNVAANLSDIQGIAADTRIVKSGISDDRSEMSSARELEAYIAEADVEQFLEDNLLVPSDAPNVRLHVVDALPARPAPLGLVLADLADWNRPREDSRIVELLRGLQWSR